MATCRICVMIVKRVHGSIAGREAVVIGRSKTSASQTFAEVAEVAIAPVPGGVGLMTIACLMLDTLKAVCMQMGSRPLI